MPATRALRAGQPATPATESYRPYRPAAPAAAAEGPADPAPREGPMYPVDPVYPGDQMYHLPLAFHDIPRFIRGEGLVLARPAYRGQFYRGRELSAFFSRRALAPPPPADEPWVEAPAREQVCDRPGGPDLTFAVRRWVRGRGAAAYWTEELELWVSPAQTVLEYRNGAWYLILSWREGVPMFVAPTIAWVGGAGAEAPALAGETPDELVASAIAVARDYVRRPGAGG